MTFNELVSEVDKSSQVNESFRNYIDRKLKESLNPLIKNMLGKYFIRKESRYCDKTNSWVTTFKKFGKITNVSAYFGTSYYGSVEVSFCIDYTNAKDKPRSICCASYNLQNLYFFNDKETMNIFTMIGE